MFSSFSVPQDDNMQYSLNYNPLSQLCLLLSLAFALLLISEKSVCQELPTQTAYEEPWEKEDISSQEEQNYYSSGIRSLPFEQLSRALISWYQKDVSTKSISRCPYAISCSRFAKRAIEEHGFLLGISLFIDRNLFRENSHMYENYELVLSEDGSMKLNDEFFLSE